MEEYSHMHANFSSMGLGAELSACIKP
jgi:hypothetical protein